MKVKVFLLFIFLYLFSVTSVISGFDRYGSNPIIKPENSYENGGIYTSSILFKDNLYKLWYSSFTGIDFEISYADSIDGIVFNKSINNPIIKPNKNNKYICEKSIYDPYVLWNDGLNKYQMWFVASCDPMPSGQARWWIKYAESSDGLSWDVREEPVIYPDKDIPWEVEGITSPSVVYKENTYHMWYSGRSSGGGWRIGYATSQDGISWAKYKNNPILQADTLWDKTHIGGQEVIWDGSQYLMFYYGANIWPPVNINIAYSSNGISWAKPKEENPILSANETEKYIGMPALLKDNSGIRMYYNSDYSGKWNISLASTYFIPTPTQIPTITPTLVPTMTLIPTPTPTNPPTPTIIPTKRSPIILIPGLFASWNKDAVLHNDKVSDNLWKLNPIVHEYDGIMKTLENLGYVRDKDYFLFTYDWRKDLVSIVDILDKYIKSKNELKNSKIQIIGHSLGGLIGRIYSDKYGKNKVEQLITLGSPHKGVPQVYPALSAGEIERDNSFFWLAQKSILVLNKSGLESDKKTIQRVFPVLFDLLPTYDYLQFDNGTWVKEDSMKLRNINLNLYKNSFEDLFPFTQTLYGINRSTHTGYKVKKASSIYSIFGNYEDGEPLSKQYASGDGTVNSNSAQADIDAVSFDMDHGDLVVKSQSIKKIMDILNISYKNTDIVEGTKTHISPSLIFFMRSPAEMKVKFGDEIYEEKDGMVFIPDALVGKYEIDVYGKDKGNYSVVVGQITNENDWWNTIKGEIIANKPTSQKDVYTFNYPDKNAFVSPTPTSIPTNTPTPFHPSATPFHPSATPTKIIGKVLSTVTPKYIANETSNKKDENKKLLNNEPSKENKGSVLGESVNNKDKRSILVYFYWLFVFIIIGSLIYLIYKNRKKVFNIFTD